MLRKTDFIESLWLRYALRPPDALIRIEGNSIRERLVRFQVEARTGVRKQHCDETLREFYGGEEVSPLPEDFMESAFIKPWELQEVQPTPISLNNFRGVEYIGKSRGDTLLVSRPSQLPILTLEAIEEWWDYEDFRSFLFHPPYFHRRFYNWYRMTVEDAGSFVNYDPMWSVAPADSNFELYLYYYTTTVKKLKGWRSPVPVYLIYRKTRLYLYVVFAVLMLSINQSERYTTKKLGTRAKLSEDFWMQDLIELRRTAKISHGVSLGLLFSVAELGHALSSPFINPILQFFYGYTAPRALRDSLVDMHRLADPSIPVDYMGKSWKERK